MKNTIRITRMSPMRWLVQGIGICVVVKRRAGVVLLHREINAAIQRVADNLRANITDEFKEDLKKLALGTRAGGSVSCEVESDVKESVSP